MVCICESMDVISSIPAWIAEYCNCPKSTLEDTVIQMCMQTPQYIYV